ncbi:MAG: hypothetical protein HC900_12780 [Methylacidiphilales bacterium]|nr:hypothetical protein [Candidatus Methylacidiphilales bacterium]
MREEERDSLPFEQVGAMSLVQIIAYLEVEARRVSGVAGFCLAMARLELEQVHANKLVAETRRRLN